ncbi:hypothetical protein ACSMXN_14790 [Jatrophihabitans sp. DSM 45814]
MAKAVLIAYSSPTSPEEEPAFHDWYENTHIGQVRAAVPSITDVTRYRVVDPTGASQDVRFVAIYEMDSSDVAADAAALGAAGKGGKLDPTNTMDVTSNPPALVWAQGL